MGAYLARRLVLIVPTLFGLSLLTFVISHVVPADPAKLAAGPRASAGMVETIREQYGLNQPLPRQYLTYLGDLFRGDLGQSIMTRHEVTDDLRDRFPATLELSFYAMLLAVCLGVPLGLVAALNQNRWPDQLSRVVAVSSVSIPQFWFGLALQLVLASSLGLLPLSQRLPTLVRPPQRITGFLTVDSLLAGQPDVFWLAVKHLALPTIVLSIGSMAIITRTLRGDLLEVMNQDFIRTARAKGLPERRVVAAHTLRNALIPSLTMIGLSIGWTLGGTILVETVFDWPGIGNYAVEAATRLDFNPIMGVTLLIGVAIIVINLVVDLLYGVLDPRISYR
ncbi:MAG TPA: ABC transporter permease [Thermomicrobiales bacterium]|nr:ABC transporter permease [Thermomicrobiales bacterium]